MYYLKLGFIGDLSGEGYQESLDNQQIRLTDLDGNTIDEAGLSYETIILEEDCKPEWGTY
jgi:hypothetical protein